MDENETPVRLPWYRKISLASGHFLNVLAISVWFPYNVSFFQQVVGLSPKNTGLIIQIAQAAGAISTPFVGMWSDQCTFKYGRRKIFHLIGVCSIAVSFFFIWHECLGCSHAHSGYQVVYFACFAAVFEFGWASTQIATLSLIPELAPDKAVKVELNSMRYTFNIIGNIVVFICFWVLLTELGGSARELTPDDATVFWIMAIVVIVLGVCVAMLFQIFVHEKRGANPPKLKWYRWLIKPQFYLVVLLFMTSRVVVLLPQTYLPLYFLETLHMDTASIAKGPLLLYISSFVTTLLIKRFNKVIGDKMIYFLGLAVVWGAVIWFWVQDPTDDSKSHFNFKRDSIYGATILLGAGGATILVISMAMISYLIGPYTGSSAYVCGWMAFSDRLADGITVNIVQQLTPGKDERDEYYRTVIVYVLLAATGVGLVTISVMYLIRRWEKKRSKKLALDLSRKDIQQANVVESLQRDEDDDSFEDSGEEETLHTVTLELFSSAAQ